MGLYQDGGLNEELKLMAIRINARRSANLGTRCHGETQGGHAGRA